jgi:hypothetical protein
MKNWIQELWLEFEEDQATYDQFNKLHGLLTVVAYHNNQPVVCGCFKTIDGDIVEIKKEWLFVKNK